MTDTNAATTAAHNARMTASFSNSTRLVKTRAELAPMASTSNTVSSNPPGLRPPRRERLPRDRSVMGRLYPPQVTSRVDRFGDSADGRVGQLLRRPIGVVRRLFRRLAAMLKPEGGDHQRERAHRGHGGAGSILAGHLQGAAP